MFQHYSAKKRNFVQSPIPPSLWPTFPKIASFSGILTVAIEAPAPVVPTHYPRLKWLRPTAAPWVSWPRHVQWPHVDVGHPIRYHLQHPSIPTVPLLPCHGGLPMGKVSASKWTFSTQIPSKITQLLTSFNKRWSQKFPYTVVCPLIISTSQAPKGYGPPPEPRKVSKRSGNAVSVSRICACRAASIAASSLMLSPA